MSSSSSIMRGSSLYSQLIDQLILFESRRKFEIQDQIAAQNTRKTAISTAGTAITALDSLADKYLESTASQFTNLKPEASDTAFFTVSNSGSLTTKGTFDFEIQQLAKNDTKFSRRFDAADNALAVATFDSTEFTLNVGTDSAVLNVDLTGVTNNSDVLNRVATAINDSGLNVRATLLRETSGTVRLSVRATETGSDSLVSVTDTNDGVTSFLSEVLEFTLDGGADNNALYAGAGGGRLYNAADLNAQFTIDGLQFERSSNTVTDAISGLNITLKKATTQTEKISIDTDTEGIRANVDTFISTFNKVNTDIRSQSFLNTATGDRGPLYSDRTFRSLTVSLRDTVMRRVEVNPGEFLSLTDIGIDARTDGTLYVRDSAKLTTAIEENGDKIQSLFSKSGEVAVTDNGLAVQLQNTIQNFVGSSSIVDSLTKSIDDRIKQLNDRVRQQDTFLANRRKNYEKQFAQLEALQSQAQSQFQVLSAIGR